MKVSDIEIDFYFKKYPQNAIVVLCSNCILSKEQIFRLLMVGNTNQLFSKNTKRLLRENVRIRKIIEEFKNEFYSESEIKYGEERKQIEDKKFFKDKFFIDKIDFESHSNIIKSSTFSDWDLDYLISQFDLKNWEELAENKNFKWSISFIEKYFSQFSVYTWKWISQREDIEWSTDVLEKYQKNLKWSEVAKNKSIPFSEETVIRFKDEWNKLYTNGDLWGLLLQNNSVQWTFDLLNFYFTEKEKNFLNTNYDTYAYLYKNTGVIWSYKFLEFKSSFNGDCVASHLNIKIPWTTSILNTYKDTLNWGKISSRADIKWNEAIKKFSDLLDWKVLSKNESVNWNYYWICEFENYIDFKALSSNTKVNWNRQILSKYKDKLDWSSLASNSGLNWNSSLIDEFEDKISFYCLTESTSFIWSTEILMKYKNRWNSKCGYYICRKRHDCRCDEGFFTPAICKNVNVIFTKEFLLDKLVEWEYTWDEFITETSGKKNLIELNGNFYDSKNIVWKDLSNNRNLSKELIIYFKDFWDYKLLIKNQDIVWDFELIFALGDKLDSSNWDYTFIKFWSNESIENLSNKFFTLEKIDEIIDLNIINL